MFDTNLFLNSTVEGANSTRRIPVPQGTYPAIVKEVKARANIAGKKDPSKSYNFLDYILTLQLTPEAVAEMGLEGTSSIDRTFSVILELTASGTLDMGKGKNPQLGQFREAVGQNDPTKPWSPAMPVGQMLSVVIAHEADDQGNPRDNIRSVGKVS